MKNRIDDLKNGKCAVENTGSKEELGRVLQAVFPS